MYQRGGYMDLPRLTPAEFDIMDVIWEGGEMTVTEVMNRVNLSQNKSFSRSTIQVQMQRLADKGWLDYSQQGRTFVFYPTVARSQASFHIVDDVKKRVFGDSCAELVRTLLDHETISSREIAELRDMIDAYSKER